MKPRVLIVDHDDAVTHQLYWSLCDAYDVMTANDMQTAIRRATIYEPAVSILDLHLPPTVELPDVGLRILSYLKAHLPASKVVVISSADTPETEKACYAVGADEYMDKPFEIEQLFAALRRLHPAPAIDFH